MKILIKGAGDLATGIAYRLRRCGYDILMTETAVPTTVRRTVAFSRAVYEGSAAVEGIESVLVSGIEEAERAIAAEKIPVIVDPEAAIREEFAPDIVVDAIIAKKNLGTTINDAGLVIGVGPGFMAGIDCHCVVETKRGHYLGRTIYNGSAIPNTGIPGEIGGYSVERIIRAAADGEFHPVRQIGEKVLEGDVVAESGGVPIKALMPGIIRGMLQEGVQVRAGMKCGDIDARCEVSHCYTISDKARAIGGGVLEAVSRYEERLKGTGIIILAAGEGRRYGSNKLLAQIGGRRMFEYCLDAAAKTGQRRTVVTGYDEIAEYAKNNGFRVVRNDHPELGISESIKLGLAAMKDCRAILFAVCDQPKLTEDTFRRLINSYAAGDKELACMGNGEDMLGNPCLFGRKYYSELEELTGDIGGKRVIMKHREELIVVSASEAELEDIDYNNAGDQTGT
ncbi:MAG: EF2563 family selenium-dependent molybdenum hydroxylase system protein [Lachnospiraceae bacterium]|nr:EF2563 family selenium-dependent molybdenum hydroxylase system protein [Lachnospiraceae bacterium]